MQVKNEAMLITYADSLGNNLKDLKTVLEKHMKGGNRRRTHSAIFSVFRRPRFRPDGLHQSRSRIRRLGRGERAGERLLLNV